jgi:hypothetical protein
MEKREINHHGVPKSHTVPVPALPVLGTPRVNPYPCDSLREICIVVAILHSFMQNLQNRFLLKSSLLSYVLNI